MVERIDCYKQEQRNQCANVDQEESPEAQAQPILN